jgi:hypothetical protein
MIRCREGRTDSLTLSFRQQLRRRIGIFGAAVSAVALAGVFMACSDRAPSDTDADAGADTDAEASEEDSTTLDDAGCVSPPQPMGRIWYVDNALPGNGDGTSWSTAWDSLAHIDWGVVSPGDTIYISGGSSEKIYHEPLDIIDVNGTATAPIVIGVGQDEQHNGIVVIDNEFVEERGNGIFIMNSNHVMLTGQVGSGAERKMRVTRSSQNGILIYNATDNVTLEYIESCFNGDNDPESGINFNLAYPVARSPESIDICGCDIHDNYEDGIHAGGIEDPAPGFDAVKIHHSRIYNIHDDGIEFGLPGLSFYNNEIGKRIYPHRGHPDTMQLYGNFLKIFNNYVYDWIANDATEFPDGPYTEGMLSVILIENDGADQTDGAYAGNILIYNNVVVETEPLLNSYTSAAISLGFDDPDWSEVSHVYVFNNTVHGDFWGGIGIYFAGPAPTHDTVHDFYIMNNILYDSTYGQGYHMALNVVDGDLHDITRGSSGSGSDVIIDNNCIYGTGTAAMPGYPDSLGYNDNGITVDPLVDGNFSAASAESPIVDAGCDVTALPGLQGVISLEELNGLRKDKNDVDRPQGAAWDIGAYEFAF